MRRNAHILPGGSKDPLQKSFPIGFIPAVGWGGGEYQLNNGDWVSLQGENMVTSEVLGQALALICCPNIFPSHHRAAVIHPLATAQWLSGVKGTYSECEGAQDFSSLDSNLECALRYVHLVFVPVNILNEHWHIIAVSRVSKQVLYFDPFHLRKPRYAGQPMYAMSRIKLFLQFCSDGQSLFRDIGEYSSAVAHDVIPMRRLPFQVGGNGCAMHCFAFAANLLSQKHVAISDANTEELRVIL